MSRNLFVSFYVHDGSHEAPLILGAIEELGVAVRIYRYLWYVRSELTAPEAARRVWDLMQPGDSLIVIDATSSELGAYNVNEKSLGSIERLWHRESPSEVVPVGIQDARDLRQFRGDQVEPPRRQAEQIDLHVQDLAGAELGHDAAGDDVQILETRQQARQRPRIRLSGDAQA